MQLTDGGTLVTGCWFSGRWVWTCWLWPKCLKVSEHDNLIKMWNVRDFLSYLIVTVHVTVSSFCKGKAKESTLTCFFISFFKNLRLPVPRSLSKIMQIRYGRFYSLSLQHFECLNFFPCAYLLHKAILNLSCWLIRPWGTLLLCGVPFETWLW